MSVSTDDDRILVKIVELTFVAISTGLTRDMSGDSNQHGIRDLGEPLNLSFRVRCRNSSHDES
jgi:hypothetical protein